MVATLGVLKSGGAYVPLDPAQPGERLIELLGERNPRPLEPEVELELGRYDHRWLRAV